MRKSSASTKEKKVNKKAIKQPVKRNVNYEYNDGILFPLAEVLWTFIYTPSLWLLHTPLSKNDSPTYSSNYFDNKKWIKRTKRLKTFSWSVIKNDRRGRRRVLANNDGKVNKINKTDKI